MMTLTNPNQKLIKCCPHLYSKLLKTVKQRVRIFLLILTYQKGSAKELQAIIFRCLLTGLPSVEHMIPLFMSILELWETADLCYCTATMNSITGFIQSIDNTVSIAHASKLLKYKKPGRFKVTPNNWEVTLPVTSDFPVFDHKLLYRTPSFTLADLLSMEEKTELICAADNIDEYIFNAKPGKRKYCLIF